MKNPRPKSFGNLIVEVIRPGICTFCGACVAVCPEGVLELKGEVPTITGKCTVCQTCYLGCPQTSLDADQIEREVFSRKSTKKEKLGVVVEVRFARALDPRTAAVGQDGAAVTAILDNLVRNQEVDSAVVSTWDIGRPWKPFPVVADDHEKILRGAGTKYTPSPSLVGLGKAVRDFGARRVAVVATPCQVRAIRRIQTAGTAPSEIIPEGLFVVGLFCMESYSYDSLIGEYLPGKGVDPAEVTKFAIKKGQFLAYSNGEAKIKVPLREIAGHVRKACKLCTDFTAEFADLSVGSVDAPPGWSTLILRNEKALEAVQNAEAAGLLETRKVSSVEDDLKMTHRLSARKKEHLEKESG